MIRAFALAALLLSANGMHAQGCSQCRDNVSQTSPQQQHAYRQAIVLMAGSALTLFAAMFAVARKLQ